MNAIPAPPLPLSPAPAPAPAPGRQRWPWVLASAWLVYSVLLLAWLDSSSALAGLLCSAS